MERSLSPAKRFGRFLLAVLLAQIWAGTLHADFEDTGVGARAQGMGGAFTALADDSRAIYYNPAGLSQLRRSEISADYGRSYINLDDNSNLSSGYFSFAIPITWRKNYDERVKDLRKLSAAGPVGRPSFANDQIPDSKKKEDPVSFYKDWGTVGAALSNTTLSGYLSQNTFWLSYGKQILNKISGGLSIKMLQESYSQTAYTVRDPVFTKGGTGVTAYAIDAGFLYNPYPKLFLGVFSSNINNPNVALHPADRDILLRQYKFGAALKEKKLNMVVDIVRWGSDTQFRAGVERWFMNRLVAARFGGGFGSRDYKNVSTGFSLNWNNFQLDYAILYPVSGIKDSYGSHKVSFIYRFGKPPANELPVGSIEVYYARLQQEMELQKARLDKAEDERSRLEKVLVEEALSRIKEKMRAENLASKVPSDKKEVSPKNLQGQMGQIGGMKTYVVAKGDSLQSIAELFYGKKDRWMDIYNLNKDKVGRGGSLKSGTVLLIPGVPSGPSITESSVIKSDLSSDGVMRPIGQTLSPLEDKAKEMRPLGAVMTPLREKSKSSVQVGQKKTHVVQPGETLSSIAQKVYGDSKRWKEIYNANKDKVNKGAVAPGDTLQIP